MVNTCKFPTISCRERGIDDERGSWLGLSSKLTCLESHQRLKCWMGLEIYATLYIYIIYYTSILLFTLQPAQNAQPITAAQPRFSGCLFADMARNRCNLATGFPWCWPSPDPSLVKPGSRIGSGYRGHRPCRILQGQSWLWHFLDRPDRKPVVWYFPDFSCQSI